MFCSKLMHLLCSFSSAFQAFACINWSWNSYSYLRDSFRISKNKSIQAACNWEVSWMWVCEQLPPLTCTGMGKQGRGSGFVFMCYSQWENSGWRAMFVSFRCAKWFWQSTISFGVNSLLWLAWCQFSKQWSSRSIICIFQHECDSYPRSPFT